MERLHLMGKAVPRARGASRHLGVSLVLQVLCCIGLNVPGASLAAARVYWTDDFGHVRRANADGTRLLDVYATTGYSPRGLAIHACKLYFSEYPAPGDPGRIRVSNVDGTMVEDLVPGLVQPGDIALDTLNGKLYWREYLGGNPLPPGGEIASKIMRVNFDGTGVEEVLSGLGIVHGIALDVGNGKVYWTDELARKIQRANLDGTGVEDVIATGLLIPDDIELGVPGKLHFTDAGTGKIQRANLDGSGREDLVTGLVDPEGLALDTQGGKMYWALTTGQKLQRANLDGTGVEDVVWSPPPLPRKLVLRLPDGCPDVLDCGDGLLSVGEACDDGNVTGDDGCSASCTVEPGWTCPGEPSVCTPICGDGLIRGGEGCDDGGTSGGDCCSATCTVEPNCSCIGEPSVCGFCGDGVVNGAEQCDLGPAAEESGNCPTGSEPTACCPPVPQPSGPDLCCGAPCCTRTCAATCQIVGRCTNGATVGGCCTTAADCGPGEGCCGNDVEESPEECDDGNLTSGDTCTDKCKDDTGLPLTCCPRGAEIAGATVLEKKKVKLTKLGAPAGDDQLKSAGEAILLSPQDMHPCTEGVSYCLEGPGLRYGPNPVDVGAPQVRGDQMARGCRDELSPRRVRAKFKDNGRPPIAAEPDGVKQIDLKNIPSRPNKFKYKVKLRDVNLAAASNVSTTLRQTIVVGDTCLVLKLTCTPAGTSTTTAICVPST